MIAGRLARHKTVGLGLLLRLSYTVGMFAVSVILSRVLGLETFGAFSYVFAYVMLAWQIARGGWPQFVVREVSALEIDKRPREVRAVVLFCLRCTVVVLSLVAATAGLAWVAGLLFVTADWPLFAIGFGAICLGAATLILSALTRGSGRVLLGQTPEMLILPVTNGAVLAALYFSAITITKTVAMLSFAAAQAAALAIALWILRHRIGWLLKGEKTESSPEWLRSVLQMSVVVWVGAASAQLPVILLGSLGAPSETGELRVAMQLAALMTLGLSVVNINFAPTFTRQWQNSDLKGLRKTVIYGCRVSLLLGLATGLPLLVAGPWIINLLFGPDFAGVAPALMAVIAAQAINTFFGPVGTLLVALRGEKRMVRTQIISLAFLVTTVTLLAPPLGALGAAIGYGASILIWNLLLFIEVHRISGIWCMPFARIKQ